MPKVQRTREQAIGAAFESPDFLQAFEAFAENHLRCGMNKNDRQTFCIFVEAILEHHYSTDIEVAVDGPDEHESHPGAA